MLSSKIQWDHSTVIYALRSCYNDDARDLISFGGENSVDVIRVVDPGCERVASFHVGTRITAIAWSLSTVSPASSDDWCIELAVAAADFGLHLLSKSSFVDETIFSFGGGLSGHHGKINDISFCGGRREDGSRYVATVSDDKMLMVWDLLPNVDLSSGRHSHLRSPAMDVSPPLVERPQPTAYVIPFSHPLISICSHPSTGKEFLVADSRGSIFLIDWRSNPKVIWQHGLRNSTLMELVEPSTLSINSTGLSVLGSVSADWRRDTTDIVGAVYGSRFAIWDMSQVRGGKPSIFGSSFPEGARHFRWCPTLPEYFAISSFSPTEGAVIDLYNMNYTHAPQGKFNLFRQPHVVRAFDFLALPGTPRIAAALSQSVTIFPVCVQSSCGKVEK